MGRHCRLQRIHLISLLGQRIVCLRPCRVALAGIGGLWVEVQGVVMVEDRGCLDRHLLGRQEDRWWVQVPVLGRLVVGIVVVQDNDKIYARSKNH
jgi:hypothetical protein